MTPEAYKPLLKDLQRLHKRLVAAYALQGKTDSRLRARLEARHSAAETGGTFDAFVDLCGHRSAVQFILRTVYVRVLEDLGALEPARLRGQWGLAAFREVAPALGLRAYFRWTFADLAHDFPALFTPGPDEFDLPPEADCQAVWDLWHEEDGSGNLKYDWQQDAEAGAFASRFLGDLYQDLDADIRKRFALLQTPEFVERYILDKTLTPALAEFDPDRLRQEGDAFRLLDPTCGSGHFLIGTYHRLIDYWQARGCDAWTASERALESVWGCDINPHAVDIAGFRLLLEVMARTGERDLDRLGHLKLNLRALDSLIPWERGRFAERQGTLLAHDDKLSGYGSAEERRENAAFLGRAFHVVVGNPPYITPKDAKKRDDYRAFWPDSAAGKYALSAPFVERLFVLGTRGAFMGQITAISFTKREFGKQLVTRVLPKWQLSHVVDASGAYIPGHGTPTVILFGQCHPPTTSEVWSILGKRGEPRTPEPAESGLVWRAIVAASDHPDDSGPFVSIAAIQRKIYMQHPWSLGGGQSSAIKSGLEAVGSITLEEATLVTGFGGFTGIDDAFVLGPHVHRARAPLEFVRHMVTGDVVRDFAIDACDVALVPYLPDNSPLLNPNPLEDQGRILWKVRQSVLAVKSFGGKTRGQLGDKWWLWYRWQPERLNPPSIAFAFVSTHNHFVLDRGGNAFKQSAPIIKLAPNQGLDDHFDLLGSLNSSSMCFWMKQTVHCMGNSTDSAGARTTGESCFDSYQFDSTKLQKAPITTRDRDARIALARALDATATERAACLPAAVLATEVPTTSLRELLAAARTRYRELTEVMVALQEELDWLTYGSYGLCDPPLATVGPDKVEPLAPGHRPFEILAARADEEADDDEKSAWWSRHGHDKVTEIPESYSDTQRARIQQRMDAIEADPRLQLLETFAFKRRWQTPDLAVETKKAAESWLLDRLEDLFAPAQDATPAGPLHEPKAYRLEEITNAWSRDPRVKAVARVYAGDEPDLWLLAESLLTAQSLPDAPHKLYTSSGLEKLQKWREVWALQDREDAGETGLTIEVPPEFKKEDFAKKSWFDVRGKLNVPRERFIQFAELRPARFGWNGWRDTQRALAQVDAYTVVETDPLEPLPRPTAEDPRRCGPTQGLWATLDDVRRWGDAGAHGELRSLAETVCGQKQCPCHVVDSWQEWVRKGKPTIERKAEAVDDGVKLEEQVWVIDLFKRAAARQAGLFGTSTALPVARIAEEWTGNHPRLLLVLDALVADGELKLEGRGTTRKYVRTETPLK
jgi:hypothetical protein